MCSKLQKYEDIIIFDVIRNGKDSLWNKLSPEEKEEHMEFWRKKKEDMMVENLRNMDISEYR